MAEPTCVMHAFSYPSGISNEAQEDNPMYALEESVSLGRFMSESLSWEKWSSFSRNRYVEEAEMYSRPGSVKQKKAYFEAHFKRMAALKAAALLEQANSTQGAAPDPPKLESQLNDNGAKIDDHAGLDVQDPFPSSPLSTLDQQWSEKEDVSSGSVASYNEEKSNDGDDQLESEVIVETDQADCNEDAFNEHFMDVEEQNPSTEIDCDLDKAQDEFEGQNPSTETECDLAKAHESCLEGDVFHECVVEEETDDSAFVADHNEDDKDTGEDNPSVKIIKGLEQAEPTEQHLMDVEKQNTSTEMESGLVKRDSSRLECSSVNQNTITATATRSKPNPSASSFIPSTPMGKRNPKLYSYTPSMDAETTSLASSPSPPKSLAQPAAVHPGKENTSTPIRRKSWIDDPEKKRTPLRMSINRELNRLISPVIKKIGSSSKASNKDCSTPLKTPAKVSVDGMKNNPPETPQSGKRRARALFDSSSGCGGTKAAGSRWQFLSTDNKGSKSPAGGKNKTSSPIIPKSFCLSGSRAAPRRKEKLEEKFNAKATESIPQQSKLKEKPKEVAKLRQSFCFGAKLSSESFREREKSKGADCKSPNKGRSRLQNMTSLPPRKPAPKGNVNSKEG